MKLFHLSYHAEEENLQGILLLTFIPDSDIQSSWLLGKDWLLGKEPGQLLGRGPGLEILPVLLLDTFSDNVTRV